MKKTLGILSLITLLATTTNAQQAHVINGDTVLVETSADGTSKLTNKNTGKTEVFQYVERMPEPPFDVYKYLSSEVKYPAKARKQKIQGKVNVKFIITQSGTIDSVQVIKSAHPLLDNEAIRVIKAMPDWKPGTQKGKPVNVYYMLPISFKL